MVMEKDHLHMSIGYQIEVVKALLVLLTTDKNGEVVDCFVIQDNDQIILVTDKGQIIRVNVNQIRIAGRSTKGVSVFKIPDQIQ